MKDFPELVSRKDRREPPPAGLRDLFELIQRASRYHQQVTIVVDALDECNENREEVLSVLRDMGQVPGVSTIVTSRTGKEHDIGAVFQGFLSISLTALRAQIEVEMKVYIREQLQSRANLVTLPPDLKVEIESSFVEKADGM